MWPGMETADLVINGFCCALPFDAIGGDPRSPGQGPGLVGDPMTAVLLVVGIGLLAVGLTLIYVKLTGGRRT